MDRKDEKYGFWVQDSFGGMGGSVGIISGGSCAGDFGAFPRLRTRLSPDGSVVLTPARALPPGARPPVPRDAALYGAPVGAALVARGGRAGWPRGRPWKRSAARIAGRGVRPQSC